ncbi:MAG: L,D-transpeptidase [Acidobacteriota bacterium]
MTDENKSDARWWRRTVGPRASGIFQVKTVFLRPSQVVRRPRKLWRPPFAWILWLLLFGVALAATAMVHRRHLDLRFGELVVRGQSAPFEIQRIRRDLASRSLDEKALERELEARLAAAEAQESADFYLVLDTRAKKLSLRVGDRVVREAPLQTGPPRPILTASGERLAPAPLSGAFTVREKLESPAWKPPASVWRAAGRPVPSPLPEIRGGLGRYVVVLTEDVVLHSPPPPESPLKGARPGSFLAPEPDLAAIWKRIGPQTRVYVF